jgi:farnesyl-diphosphate farnesyltransferase
VAFCDEILCKVSRSFAAVIKQLPRGLCVEIMIFYLVLRALDTVEDDMEAFKDDTRVKVRHLETFFEVALEDPTFAMKGVGKVGSCFVAFVVAGRLAVVDRWLVVRLAGG